MENFDDLVQVARDCARSIHGREALIAVEEMSSAYPVARRFRAAVRVRGVVVEAHHASGHSGSLKALAKDLASRSRGIVREHESTSFRAAVLGL